MPALEAAGFDGRFPRYRRVADDSIQLLAVFYGPANTAFFLEFGSHPRGNLQTSWGEIVEEDKLLLEHVPFPKRARLQERADGGSVAEQWFQIAAFGEDTARYDRLATRVAALFAQVETWLRCGQGGPNISTLG
jgi:hypothetical protein